MTNRTRSCYSAIACLRLSEQVIIFLQERLYRDHICSGSFHHFLQFLFILNMYILYIAIVCVIIVIINNIICNSQWWYQSTMLQYLPIGLLLKEFKMHFRSWQTVLLNEIRTRQSVVGGTQMRRRRETLVSVLIHQWRHKGWSYNGDIATPGGNVFRIGMIFRTDQKGSICFTDVGVVVIVVVVVIVSRTIQRILYCTTQYLCDIIFHVPQNFFHGYLWRNEFEVDPWNHNRGPTSTTLYNDTIWMMIVTAIVLAVIIFIIVIIVVVVETHCQWIIRSDTLQSYVVIPTRCRVGDQCTGLLCQMFGNEWQIDIVQYGLLRRITTWVLWSMMRAITTTTNTNALAIDKK